MKYLLPLLFSLTFMACPASLEDLIDTPLTNADISNGLKQALNLGTGKAVDFLSAKDGYFKSAYKILLPEEARQVTDKLKVIPGFSNVENIVLERINRAAEDAATKAGPIFLDAIKSITINDALSILTGADDAATEFLHAQTFDQLYSQFQPELLESLEKFNAVSYWEDAVNAYNRIPLLADANPRLDDYVTQEALKGLFSLVEQKEAGIRSDVSQRVTPLLQRVFAKQD
jgi:hypothetical protein